MTRRTSDWSWGDWLLAIALTFAIRLAIWVFGAEAMLSGFAAMLIVGLAKLETRP